MKTKLLLFGVFALIAIASQAQYQSFAFGLRMAPQLCWMHSTADHYSGEGIKMGFSWGFTAEKFLTENQSFATGFNIKFVGGKLSIPQSETSENEKVTRFYYLKYFEIPATFKMRTNPIKGFRYFGQIGLGTNFRIDANLKDEIDPKSGSNYTTDKYNYEKTTFLYGSLIVGIGAEYKLSGKTSVGAGLTFNNGFTDVLTETNPNKEKGIVNSIGLDVFVLF